MTTCRCARIRRFRFNLPQCIAAVLLTLFLVQGLWLANQLAQGGSFSLFSGNSSNQAGELLLPSDHSLAGCENWRDAILACRLARLSIALNWPAENLLERLPFLAAGVLLGGALWWVARRLYGNLGGYTALVLFCFSATTLQACSAPNAEILAALAVYGGVYTCIGVAHAMQGPRRKWRPRIVLLTAIFFVAAAAHLAALATAALIGLAFMLWIAEGRRRQLLPVVLVAVGGALAALYVFYGFSLRGFLSLFYSGAWSMSVSLRPAMRFFGMPANTGITLATAAAAVLYLSTKRSRYFGNTAPLLCAAFLLLTANEASSAPGIEALPFLLTFVSGVLADAYEEPKGQLAVAAAGAIVLLQCVLCVQSLPWLRY